MTSTSRLSRFFDLEGNGTTLARECVAGLTTFGAMSYVLVVSPMILANAGFDRGGQIITTATIAIIGTLAMALWARLPLAVAPGMSSNVMLATVVIGQMGLSYGIGFAMIFMGGLGFLVLSVSGWRERIIMALPRSIQLGVQCGLGVLIAYIGLHNGGIVAIGKNRVSFGNLAEPSVLLTYAGLLVVPIMAVTRMPGALPLSIAVMTIAGLYVPLPGGHAMTRLPDHWWSWPTYPTQYFMAIDFRGFFSHLAVVLPLTLYFFLADFFSATTTLMAIAGRPPLRTADGKIRNAQQAFTADASVAVASAIVGTSTAGVYIESAAGVEAGGRTGLTSLVVAALFGVSLFFWPLLTIIPAQAVAPVLCFVGLLMLRGITELDTRTPEGWLPAIMIIVVIATTTNLMMAMASGCFVYTFLVAWQRQWKLLTPMMLVLDAALAVYVMLQAHIG